MAKSIRKWVMDRYSILWERFADNPISFKQIKDTLKIDDKNVISVFLNELRKSGWVDVKLDKEDIRKRLYTLKSPNKVIMEISKNVTQESKNRDS